MSIPTLQDSDVTKLKRVIEEGCRVKQDMQALKEGLADTVSAVCEELDLNKSVLNKAINTVFKANYAELTESYEDLDELLEIVKKK